MLSSREFHIPQSVNQSRAPAKSLGSYVIVARVRARNGSLSSFWGYSTWRQFASLCVKKGPSASYCSVSVPCRADFANQSLSSASVSTRKLSSLVPLAIVRFNSKTKCQLPISRVIGTLKSIWTLVALIGRYRHAACSRSVRIFRRSIQSDHDLLEARRVFAPRPQGGALQLNGHLCSCLSRRSVIDSPSPN